MSGFVYLWTNRINGMKYLGSHLGSVNDGYIGSGLAFQNAVRKYGLESFDRTIVEYVETKDDIRSREQYHLDRLGCAKSKDFYNISHSSTGGNMGQDYSKIADRMRKNNPNAGGKSRKAYIEKHGKAPAVRCGFTDKHRADISERMKRDNPVFKLERNPNATMIVKIDPTTKEEIKVYSTLKEATEAESFTSSIFAKLDKEVVYKGFLWKRRK